MNKQNGLSLIEVMISLAVGLFLLMAILSIYGIGVKSNNDILRNAQLNYDMEAVMTLIVNDIRRAGYWNHDIYPNDSFFKNLTDISIQDNGSTILYSYDENENGIIVDPDEKYGFKLENESGVGVIKMKTKSTWGTLTNQDQLDITSLAFSLPVDIDDRCINNTDSTRACSEAITGDELVEKVIIDVSMTGRLKSDSNVTHSLNNRIEVRNHKLYTVN